MKKHILLRKNNKKEKVNSGKYATEEGANNRKKKDVTTMKDVHPLSKEALDVGCKYDQCYTSETGQKNLVFATDYNYIGGFSQGATDEMIMQHIYRDGPVVVSMSVDAVGSQFFLTDGGDVLINEYVKLQKEPRPDNKNIRRWAALSHAVIAVGWGEETLQAKDPDTGKDATFIVPYWIVRNSWGKDWSKRGYTKMLRGHNYAGMEYQAEYIIPDVERMQAMGLI